MQLCRVLLRLRSGRTRTTATHNTTERLASQNDYGKSWIFPPAGSYFSELELLLVGLVVPARRIHRGITPTGILHGRCRRTAFRPSSSSPPYFPAPTDRTH